MTKDENYYDREAAIMCYRDNYTKVLLTDSRSPLNPGILLPNVAIDDADRVNGVKIDGSASSSIVCPNVSKVNLDRSAAFRRVLIA